MNKLTDKETEGTEKVNIQTESIKKFQFVKVINTEKQDRRTVIDGQKDRQTYGQKNIYIDILTDKQAEIQTGSQMS